MQKALAMMMAINRLHVFAWATLRRCCGGSEWNSMTMPLEASVSKAHSAHAHRYHHHHQKWPRKQKQQKQQQQQQQRQQHQQQQQQRQRWQQQLLWQQRQKQSSGSYGSNSLATIFMWRARRVDCKDASGDDLFVPHGIAQKALPRKRQSVSNVHSMTLRSLTRNLQ